MELRWRCFVGCVVRLNIIGLEITILESLGNTYSRKDYGNQAYEVWVYREKIYRFWSKEIVDKIDL